MARRIDRDGIRFRTTALATSVVAVVLIATAGTLLLVQRQQTLANLDAGLRGRAADIATLLASHSETPDAIADTARGAFVQLIDSEGHILVSSPGSAAHFITDEWDRTVTSRIRTLDNVPVDDDAFRVLSRTVDTADGPAILHLGRSLDEFGEGLLTLAGSLAVAIPIVLIVMTALIWWLVGRILAPVESIRSRVADIGASELSRRVPLPDSEDEIRRLAETMNDMLDRLENAVGRQQRFVADASHELRSPLARIRTELETKGAGDVDLASIREELIALQNLVSDLLALARFDSGETARRHQIVDLDDLVLREGQNARAEGVGVDLSGVNAVQASGNPQQLSRAIRNLVENARVHASSGIELGIAEDNGFAVITVTDDGPGIPPDKRDRVFERFARLDDARGQGYGGTGLGLAIALEIAVRHDGSISIDPDYDSGARFVMRLPAHR